MIEQRAIVLAVADGSALVEVRRASGCAACQVGEHCGTAAVAKLFDKAGHTRLRLADPIGLAPGDQILIGIPDPVLIRASLTAYLLPLLALIMVAGAAEQAGLGAVSTALSGLAGLVLGLWLAGRLTGGSRAKASFSPRLLRRLAP